MSEHTQEPWYVGAQNDALYIVAGRPPALNNDYPVHDADRTLIAAMKGDSYRIDSANAKRIAACVNAMQGIDDNNGLFAKGNSVRRVISSLEIRRATAEQQRDELLSALEALASTFDPDAQSMYEFARHKIEAARAAIAKAKAVRL